MFKCFIGIGILATPHAIQDVGIIGGAVGGAAALGLLLIVVAVCCCCCKKKKQAAPPAAAAPPTVAQGSAVEAVPMGQPVAYPDVHAI